MSGNLGGYDPRSYRQSLEGPGTQQPKWKGTTQVGGENFEQTVRRDQNISLAGNSRDQTEKKE